jgi:hypothetical protein
VVKNYRDQLLEEIGGGDDDEKKLIHRKDLGPISLPKTTYAGPLESPLAPNQGTYNPNRTPLTRNFSRPNRGRPSHTSKVVPLPSAATRTTFPSRVKTTVSHYHKKSLSNSTYFDPTEFYRNSAYSEYPERYADLQQEREFPPPIPSRYTETFRESARQSRLQKTHSRSDSGSSFSSGDESDATSRSRFSDDSSVSFESLEDMLKPAASRGTSQLSMGTSLSSVPSLRRPPPAVVPVRF